MSPKRKAWLRNMRPPNILTGCKYVGLKITQGDDDLKTHLAAKKKAAWDVFQLLEMKFMDMEKPQSKSVSDTDRYKSHKLLDSVTHVQTTLDKHMKTQKNSVPFTQRLRLLFISGHF